MKSCQSAARGLPGRGGRRGRRLGPGLAEAVNQSGHGQARQARQEKGRPPAPVAADEAAHQVGQGRAQRNGQVEQAQGPGPTPQGQDVRQVGRGQGAEGGLSHPHQAPGEDQGGIGRHPEGQAGGQAPEHRASGHEAVAA